MHFVSRDLNESLLNAVTDEPHTHVTLSQNNCYLFADDAAYSFHIHGDFRVCKMKLRHFLRQLNTNSINWGLFINWSKSAIQLMFKSIEMLGKNLHDLSDQLVEEDLLLHLNMIDNEPTSAIRIPLVKSYKYLGIQISWNMTLASHLSYIKPKITFLVNSFLSIRKASNSVRFCFNTWQLFVRPLLDYSCTYAFYCESTSSADKLRVLYRTSLRQMLMLKNYIPVIVCLKNLTK